MDRRRHLATTWLALIALATAPAWPTTPAAASLAAQEADRPAGDGPVDLVLVNGKVVTLDPERPEAQAVAVRGDRIVAVGSDEEIRGLAAPDTRVIDLRGRLAVPGFIEGHGHFTSLGESRLMLDLTTASSWSEIVAMVRDAAAEAAPGEWIRGRGWHQEKWDSVPGDAVEGVPVHATLSEASPENPVILTHASGHASFVNAAAMRRAGIDADTPDPEGGEIVRDAAGEPTGLLRETAQGLARRALAEDRSDRPQAEVEEERRRIVRLAAREALAKGVTTFHDAGSSFETIDRLRGLAEAGELPIRLYVMVRGESNEAMARRLPEYRLIGHADHRLTVRSIKRQVDGALGSHGAWLLEPYSDLSRSSGLVLEPLEEIARTAEIALEHGFQVNTHAIGDRANREILDLYEVAFEEAGADGDTLRWRIEHAQHLASSDVPRFEELGVIASMQAIHACSDGPWVAERLGRERAAEGAYVWQDLIDAGAVVTNGTDVPVEDVDPIASFHCSVTRRTSDGPFYPNQTMTREQALRSYTIANAYAAFEEDLKGTITPGKLADIAVLSRDIMTVPAEEIPGTEVVYTIVGGEVAHEADGEASAEGAPDEEDR